MDKYNDNLVEAGVRVMAKGLYPGSTAVRISYPEPGNPPIVKHGPFEEPREMIAGFILIDVNSREEALEWALRMPDPIGYGEGEIELRQVIEDPETYYREVQSQFDSGK